MPNPVKLSLRLQVVFEKTKILCFGRYAMELPQEAQLIVGNSVIGNSVKVAAGGLALAKLRVNENFKRLQWEEPTAEMMYSGPGPITDNWQVRYFADKFHKSSNTLFFDTYIGKGDLTFVTDDSIGSGETEQTVITRQLTRAKIFRLRGAEEVPAEAGYCVQHGFLPGDQYEDQETFSAGIYIPSLADVTFSVSSNKNAYADYPVARFEEMKLNELPLLARIKSAKATQGILYTKRDVLREGKRDIHHWKGAESLIRRPDGTQDVEWAFIGTPKLVATPSEFHVAMFTKVEANMVGAAKKASVTDDEAVALWDKLLSGLKFRVDSYYLPKNSPVSASKK
ncbi:MAG: T6SS immunity protein Tli4 family protein [Pseudomonadota bacterium]|nr:T6SS immunity protein Tli4 family protein [Pseudomonadota bacterium]